ncbi:hypothetical protein ACYX7E_02305 [Luteimonas sp. RIT-PG2_3]|jgi:hypothetical protein
MAWLLLLLSLVAFVIAFISTSVALSALCLLAALILLVLGVLGVLAQRVGSRSRDDTLLLDPQDLRRLREQAEVRLQTAGSDASAVDGGGGGAAREPIHRTGGTSGNGAP